MAAFHSSNAGQEGKRVKLPGWNENVAPAKKDALFWHSVWMSLGRPKAGGLYQVMRWTRNKFHYAVRKAKRMAGTMKAKKLLLAAEEGNLALMKEMRNTLGKKNNEQTVPESLDGNDTHDAILERFRECYEELYNSAGTEDAMKMMKTQLQNTVKENTLNARSEVGKVTGKIVKQACRRMLPGKTDVSESYTSDVFLNAPDSLFDQLAAVFRSFLVHGTVSPQILCCAFLPLFKGGVKNPAIFDSYRAIAGGSQLLKLFEYVILLVWGDLLCSDSMQFGFKSGASTTQCTWLVNEVTTFSWDAILVDGGLVS